MEKTYLNAVSLQCRAALNLPGAILELDQLQALGYLRGLERAGNVLLVGEHQQRNVFQFVIEQQFGQFVARFLQALAIAGVDHVNLKRSDDFS